MLKRHLKAGVLYYTLFVALIMLLITGLFILLFYQDSIFMANIKRNQRTLSFFSSAITLSLSSPAKGAYNLLLFEDDPESKAIIAQKEWGLFDILSVSLPEIAAAPTRSYLIGVSPHDSIRQTGLYMANNFSYLSISGSTMLTGRTYLPYSGIASSSIEGVGYYADSLVYGKKLLSKDTLPSVFAGRLKELYSKVSHVKGVNTMPIGLQQVSFSKDVGVVRASQLLPPCKLFGHIIIMSKDQLTIPKEACLKNVLVFAPKVTVEAGFNGSCQIFATDTVLVQKNVKLRYPSGITVYSNKEGYIELDSTARVYGYVITYSKERNKVGVRIKPAAIITGFAYCNSKVDHRGTIFGSLYAQSFEFRTGWGLYTSSLLNAKVLGRELSPCFIFPVVAPGRKSIITRVP